MSLASLVVIARPKGTLVLLLVPLLGWGMAHWDRALPPTHVMGLVWVLLAWTALSSGTMWLNASLDGAEGGALFASSGSLSQRSHLVAVGHVALAVSVVFAFASSITTGVVCVLCALLSVLYSHPRTQWKGHPWLGPMVNALGYGMLSCLAGWFVVGYPLSVRVAIAFGLLTIFVLGMTFAAQAFQRDDDARRGYRTLVVTHGSAACLRVGHACVRITIVGVAIVIALGVFPRVCLIGLPTFLFADRWMSHWRTREHGGSSSDAAGLLYRMIGAGALLIAIAYVNYLYTGRTT